jgi:MFS transporter, LPLT family, lysophospholipid transporter
MPSGFHLLIAAQFASALADNALLIVAIALLHERGMPMWWAPMLKFSFTLSYVLLAPFVGPLADAFRKARLMACMNAVKVLGVLALLAGVHPVAAFAVIGFGAATYAPAKYGLITEMVGPKRLVAANGWIEVSVVGAALLGTVLGGLLISPWLLESAWVATSRDALAAALPRLHGGGVTLSLLAVLLIYGIAAALNAGVPDSGARYASSRGNPIALTREFRAANRMLWSDRAGGLSLAVTTVFWGLGATLQFAVLRWAAQALQLTLDHAAYLQAAVAIGVVIGATAAARWVPLAQAKNMLGAGVVLGLLLPVMASTTHLGRAVPLLVLLGVVGGLLVVPLNALLQHRGFVLLSAGRSIAVQGFNENASVLAMLGVYAALVALDVPVVAVLAGLGVSIAVAMAALMLRERGLMQRESAVAVR